MSKILVIGCGFVGSTVADSLEENTVHEIVRIDPKYYDTKLEQHLDAHAAIVCVPTPPNDDGSCDTSIVDSVIDTIGYGRMPTLVRSTMPPDAIEKYPYNVVYNPEFLREATATEDFANQKTMIFGVASDEERYLAGAFGAIFSYLKAEVVVTDRRTASMIKYVHNTWLATKVTFFHELYRVYGDKFNYNDMTRALAKFENIGPSHMAIPDPENLGYGGHCFPKDVQAFIDFTGHELVEEVHKLNECFKNS